jgi:hypothetical protein
MPSSHRAEGVTRGRRRKRTRLDLMEQDKVIGDRLR